MVDFSPFSYFIAIYVIFFIFIAIFIGFHHKIVPFLSASPFSYLGAMKYHHFFFMAIIIFISILFRHLMSLFSYNGLMKWYFLKVA
jgi:hypothetical protein